MNSFIPVFIMFCMLNETVGSVSISIDRPSQDHTILTCSITNFSVPATWSNNNTVLTTCFPGGPCSPTSLGKYNFSANASAIVVQISSFVLGDEFGWQCKCDNNTAIVPNVFTDENGVKIGAAVGGSLGLIIFGFVIWSIYYFKDKICKTIIQGKKPEQVPLNPIVTKDNTETSGSSSAVSREQVQVQMENKGVKDDDEERPPAVHTGTQNKVDPSKQTKYRQQPVPPANTGFEDNPTFRPLPPPPQKGEIKDRNVQGISATIGDTLDLASETPRPSKLPPIAKQETVQEVDALEESKQKRKRRKKKRQVNEKTLEDENGETI